MKPMNTVKNSLFITFAVIACTLGASVGSADEIKRELDSRKCPATLDVTANGFRYLSFLDYLLNAEKKLLIRLEIAPGNSTFICDYTGVDHEGRPYAAYMIEEGIVPVKPEPGATRFPRLYIRTRFELRDEDPRTYLRLHTWINLRESERTDLYEPAKPIEISGSDSQLFSPMPEICTPEYQPPGCVWIPSP